MLTHIIVLGLVGVAIASLLFLTFLDSEKESLKQSYQRLKIQRWRFIPRW